MKNDDISLDRNCGGTSIVKEFFKHLLPRGDIRRYPPRFLDGCKHTCSYAHRSFRRCIFLKNYRAVFPSSTPPCFFPLFYLAHSRYVNTSPSLTAQDAKGNIYRLAGKAKRLAFQAFHRYPPAVSSDCVFMRAEIPENKSQHTPGHSFPKVDDTTEIVLQNFLSRTRDV